MKCWIILCIFVFTLARGAPVDKAVEIDGQDHRESTKQILELEQELKQQAGEDKKFFPSEAEKVEKAAAKEAALKADVDGLVNGMFIPGELTPGMLNKQQDQKDEEQLEQLAGKSEHPSLEDAENFKMSEGSSEEMSHELKEPEKSSDQLKDEEIKGDEIVNENIPYYGEPEDVGKLPEDETEEENEQMILQNVMEALHNHPELVEELEREEAAAGLQPGDLVDDANEAIVAEMKAAAEEAADHSVVPSAKRPAYGANSQVAGDSSEEEEAKRSEENERRLIEQYLGKIQHPQQDYIERGYPEDTPKRNYEVFNQMYRDRNAIEVAKKGGSGRIPAGHWNSGRSIEEMEGEPAGTEQEQQLETNDSYIKGELNQLAEKGMEEQKNEGDQEVPEQVAM